jgi:hypothetical protein
MRRAIAGGSFADFCAQTKEAWRSGEAGNGLV